MAFIVPAALLKDLLSTKPLVFIEKLPILPKNTPFRSLPPVINKNFVNVFRQ